MPLRTTYCRHKDRVGLLCVAGGLQDRPSDRCQRMLRVRWGGPVNPANPANPANPVNPVNPMNPVNPVNPMNHCIIAYCGCIECGI